MKKRGKKKKEVKKRIGSKKKPQNVGEKGNNLGIPTLDNRAIPTKAYLRP